MKPEIIEFKLHADDRGMVYGALTDLDKRGIKRTYVVKNWSKGMVRAWHGHKKADTYIHVIKGAAKLAAVEIFPTANKAKELITVLTEHSPSVLFVPAGYFNGAMSLEDDTRLLVYSTLTLDEVKNDDFRAHYTECGGEKIWEIKPR